MIWLILWAQRQIDMDGAEYARLAQHLVHGGGYDGMFGHVDLSFPPLYPALLAIVRPITQHVEAAGIVVSLVAGTLLVVPVYGIARRLYGAGAALWSALLVALCPFVSILATMVLTDAVFLLLAFCGLYFWLRASDERETRSAVFCGLSFGLAALTRPEGFLLCAAALGFCFVRNLVERRGRDAVVVAVATLLPFLALAGPYVYVQSHLSGHVRLEGKTAVNYAIGQRINSGMSYIEAADGLDAQGRAIGAELAGVIPADAPKAGINPGYLSFLARNAVHHFRDAASVLRGYPYDRGLLALLAVLGLVTGPWSKPRAWHEAALVCFGLTVFVSLASVAHFWDRYDDTFIPLLAVWGGKSLNEVFVRAGRYRPVAATIAVVAMTVIFVVSGRHQPPKSVAKKDAGTWIGAQQPKAGLVMESSDLAAFYAGANWRSLPYAQTPLALRYIAGVAPSYVVLESDAANKVPYLADWLRHGIPDRRATLVHVDDSGGTEVAVYRWNDSRPPVTPRKGGS